MGVVIMDLHSSWKWVVFIELQLNCNELHDIYTMSYDYATHSTCLLTFMMYKYNGLQVFGATQKLNLYLG
jgi:hypothetical protein